MATCKSCGAKIILVKTESGKKMPLDPPSGKGNILLDLDSGEAKVLILDDLKDAQEAGLVLYLSHFSTCPQAKEHQKPKTAS